MTSLEQWARGFGKREAQQAFLQHLTQEGIAYMDMEMSTNDPKYRESVIVLDSIPVGTLSNVDKQTPNPVVFDINPGESRRHARRRQKCVKGTS